eukprot:6750703-Prymnesium_polylepis.1
MTHAHSDRHASAPFCHRPASQRTNGGTHEHTRSQGATQRPAHAHFEAATHRTHTPAQTEKTAQQSQARYTQPRACSWLVMKVKTASAMQEVAAARAA